MTEDYTGKLWKFLAFYFAILYLATTCILLSGCATSVPLGAMGKYGSVSVAISYYPPSDFCGVFPPSYLPEPKGFRK